MRVGPNKSLAGYFSDWPDATKPAESPLPALAEPKSARTLDAIISERAAVRIADVWYCLCIGGSIEKVVSALEKAEMETYFPLGKVVKTIRSRGMKRSIQKMAPAFPGYLFVRFANDHLDWPMVRDTTGVLGVLGNAEFEPRRIFQSEIDRMQARQKRGEYNWDWRDPDRPKFAVVKNDRVQISTGVLAQYTGVVTRTPKSRTVQVVPDLFPDTVVHIDIRDLKIIA